MTNFLTWLVLPPGNALVLMILGLGFRRRWLVMLGLAILWVSGMPLASGPLARLVERGVDRRPAMSVSPADAIVVLSSSRTVAPGPEAIVEWHDPDRFLAGLELWQQGRAPRLVFTDAPVSSRSGIPSEGRLLADEARRHGVPVDRIVISGRATNTREEAGAVATALGARSGTSPVVILVTSAIHMTRARLECEAAGLRVDPFPVDFRGTAFSFRLMGLLPTAASLQLTQASLKEVLGETVVRLRSGAR